MGSAGIASPFLTLTLDGGDWLTYLTALPQGKVTVAHCVEGWVSKEVSCPFGD
jgi:hypothetical protein